MPRFGTFIKTTLLGGLLVVVPAYLALLLLIKALAQAKGIVTPLSAALPKDADHPQIMAVLLLILLCFLVGLVLRTAIGQRVGSAVEGTVLHRLPGYRILHNVAMQMRDSETNRGFRPALAEVEEGLAPCFIVEEHADGRVTIFLPSSPTPLAGTILIVDRARVHPSNVTLKTAFKCISQWGTGAGQMLAAMLSDDSGKG